MATFDILAPLSGWASPLEEVPDAAFAGRMVGDGVAIDPVDGILRAPCDGEVIARAAANHAITVRAADGLDVLMHVGVDTVRLAGRGFKPRVEVGQRVQAGDVLLEFDLDLLAREAPSLLTPVLVLDGGSVRILSRTADRSVKAGDALLTVEIAVAPQAKRVSTGPVVTRRIVIALEHGIHARPAALLAQSLRSLEAEVFAHAQGKKASVRSAVALMALGIRRGDQLTLEARGADSEAALDAIEKVLGEVREPRARPRPLPVVARAAVETDTHTLGGAVASRGIAIGRAVQLVRPEPQVAEAGRGAAEESAALQRAREAVKANIRQLASTAQGALRDVLEAHVAFLDDGTLGERAAAWIARGKSAGFAWRQSVNESVADLRGVGDERLRERVDDLNDLATQVLLALAGRSTAIELPERAIVLADELLPSQFVALPRDALAGFCVGGGGTTSHVAILAAAAAIPMLVAVGPAVLAVPDGATVVLDAEEGRLLTQPTAGEIEAAEQSLARRQRRRATDRARAQEECRTADGVRIELFANVGSVADARAAMEQGAEGCGLLRTEFLFLDRQTAPEERFQIEQYQSVASIFSNRPVVIRTLDAGGDKPIAYLPMPAEENPALGLRGIRTSLWRPDLLRTQLRAVLAVQPAGQCRLLLPMITGVDELLAVRAILDEERASVGSKNRPAVGVMVETPAAALQAASLAAHSDFLSIGTNDLTQYTLAMDRGHPELAAQLDALHPAVLGLIAATVDGARQHGRKISVCGGLASDPVAASILIGLGVEGLSVVPSVIAELKGVVRRLNLADCRSLAERALALPTSAAVRHLAANSLEELA